MGKRAIYEQLDEAIDQLLAEGEAAEFLFNDADGELADVLEIADHLRQTPTAEFRARLKSDLAEVVQFVTAGRTEYESKKPASPRLLQMPRPMFSAGPATYPVRRQNFMLSMLAHTAALALLVGSGAWIASNKLEVKRQEAIYIEPSDYVLSITAKAAHGGGGGGDNDPLQASQGMLPKQSLQQITPPAVVLRSNDPKLAVEPTVVAPPINMANVPNLGDPISKMLAPASNGTGSGAGIGAGSGGGVGIGRGPGVGIGIGGGVGGGIYRVGGGVSAPRAIYAPDPDYSEEARKARYQGTVTLWLIVDANGHPTDVKIARSLGMGLDQRAIEAVKTWRFDPAMKDGHPVSVQINVEVNFRMY